MFFDKWCCHQLAMSPTWSFHPDLWWWQQKCKLPWLINFTCQLDLVVKNSINPFYPIFYFYTPWKYQKTFRFLTFSGGIEIEHWPIIGKYYIYSGRNKTGDHFSRKFWSKIFGLTAKWVIYASESVSLVILISKYCYSSELDCRESLIKWVGQVNCSIFINIVGIYRLLS